MAEPSPSEITRRLATLEDLVRGLPDRLDAAYLRRETYEADQRADAVLLRGLETEVRNVRQEIEKLELGLATNRRMLLTGLLFPVLVLLAGAVLLAAVGLR